MPTVEFGRSDDLDAPQEPLADRADTLDGKVVGFADGWAHRQADGSFTMYPLMGEIHRFLTARFDLADHTWLRKPNISHPLTDEELDQFLEGVDVVVNGECA